MTAPRRLARPRRYPRDPAPPAPGAIVPEAASGLTLHASPWTFRPIREEDLAVIAGALSPAPYRTHADDLDWHLTGQVTELIAWHESLPVGSGFIHWSGPRDVSIIARWPSCPEIFRLEVVPTHRSRGIGAALVGALEALALARGFARVGLGVGIANERARVLYERLGYRAVDAPPYIDRWEYPDPHGQRRTVDEPCVFMMRELSPPHEARPRA